jgi:predicted homoserine dehydrogenase-like protein
MRPGLKRREATIAADMAGLGVAANAADMEGLEVVANAAVVAVSVGDAAAGVEEEAVSTAEAAAEAAAAEAETDNIWSDVLESRWFAGLGVVRFTYYSM